MTRYHEKSQWCLSPGPKKGRYAAQSPKSSTWGWWVDTTTVGFFWALKMALDVLYMGMKKTSSASIYIIYRCWDNTDNTC